MNREHGHSVSRRSLLKYSAVGATSGIIGSVGALKVQEYLENRGRIDAYYSIDAYKYKYHDASVAVENLFSSLKMKKAELELDRESQYEIKGKIGSIDEAPAVMVVTGEYDETISLNITELEVADKQIIVPLVQSEHFSQTCIFLGNIGPKAEFRLKTLDVGDSNKSRLDSLNLAVYSLSSDHPLMKSVIKNSPELYIRKDNKEDRMVSNDIPISSDVRVKENQNGVLMLEHWISFSGEDKGSAPYPLIYNENRLTDIEIVAFTKVTENGEKLEEAYQGKDHKVIVHEQYFENPVQVDDATRLALTIETSNNMVVAGGGTGRSFSYFPDDLQIRLGILTGLQKVERDRALNVLAIRESISQGFIQPDDGYVKWYIQRELGGVDLITPVTKHASTEN